MNQRTIRALTFALAIPAVLSGCGFSFFVPPKSNPIIEDAVYGGDGRVVGTLATTPERRIVIVNVAEGHPDFGRFCSEAPADASESISSTFQAALEAKVKEQGGAAEVASTLATAVQALTQRSQGLQLYRDASYAYCVAYLNDALSAKEYTERIDSMTAHAVDLIKFELKTNNGTIGRSTYPILGPPAQQKLESLLKKAIEAGEEEQSQAEQGNDVDVTTK